LEQPDSPEAAPQSPGQAPTSPDYVPGPEHPPSPVYPLPDDASPVALSSGYVVDSDLEEDLEEDHVDYPADGGDDNDEPFDDEDNDEDDEPFEDEDDDGEEEEHLASADSPAIPIVDPIPSARDTEAFETDETAPTPVPSPRRHIARKSIRPEAPMPFTSKEKVERLLVLPPPPSPLISLSPPSSAEYLARCLAAPALPSSPLPIVPHPYGSPNHMRAPPGFKAAMASLFIPPLVDRREDIPEAELPPRKRLCLAALTSRYEVGESSTAAPRLTGGHRIDYGFIGTLDAETRRQRAEEVSYGIRDVWIDSTEAVEEVAPTTLEGDNTRVTELAVVQEQDTQDIYDVIEDTQDR
ncbi:hypothetical protein Tco_1542838, partial [Tanacetum coccineum]